MTILRTLLLQVTSPTMLTILKIMQLLPLDQDEDIKVKGYCCVVSGDFYEKKKVSLFISMSKVANIVLAAPF